jgi:hypothetical protein
MVISLIITASLVVALAPRIWWLLVTRPRWQRRCDRYIEHGGIGQRCPCSTCTEFRREMRREP